MREKRQETPIERYRRRLTDKHLFGGLCWAAAAWNRPLSEAILVYRQRTGDELTSDVTLYAWRVELTQDFKHASDEAVQL